MMRTFGFPEFVFILQAAQWTVALSLIAFLGGAIGGLAVALGRTSESRVAQALSGGFIQIFQGTPLLLQLFLNPAPYSDPLPARALLRWGSTARYS